MWFRGIYNHFTSNSRGVAILFGNNIDYSVNKVKRDLDVNMLAMSLSVCNLSITLICIYGPNDDSPDFYSNIKDVIYEFDDTHYIICGDWNLILNFDLDTSNYVRINNPNARKEVLRMMNDLSLCDPWREFNPLLNRYTWRQDSTMKQARLDFFLISGELMNYVSDTKIGIKYKSDHSCITLNLRLSSFNYGKGF